MLTVYECMAIYDSNKYAQDPNGVGHQVAELVEKLGGEVLVSRLWNEQKLAYPIDGHRKGTYWITYLRMDGSKLSEFTRSLQINESVLRQLTLKVEPRLVEALVDHVKSGGKAKTTEIAPEAAPAAAAEEAV